MANSVESLHQPGEIIGDRYRISGILGRGGISTTYAAEDNQTGESVALKALSFKAISDWKTLELFEREAKVLAQLSHPAIPNYLDYFQVDTPTDRHFYIAQQLVEGKSLAALVAAGWHGAETGVKQIAIQVLEILVYLHELRPPVVHRDIKPQNIIQQPDGKIFLVDFGAVQDVYRHTQIGGSTVVGTYGYMPPEQFRGRAVPVTDLYGLGATLLFLLTGRSPSDLPERKFKIDFRDAVDVSSEFADWLELLLEPDLEDRFDSARRALAVLRGDGVLAKKNQLSRKPAGSRVKLTKTSSRLTIEIPPGGLNGGSISILFFSLFWTGFVAFWTVGAASASIFFAMFSIPFWFVGIGMLLSSIAMVATRTHLEIDRRNFRIDRSIFGYSWRVKGLTADINDVKTATSHTVNDRPVKKLILVEGVRDRGFGTDLAAVEQEWLQQEILDFLTKAR